MNSIQAVSCVRFVQRNEEADYLTLRPAGKGCRSYIGMIGGNQEISLDNFVRTKTCVKEATVMHELIHALGYAHMHSHQDRDNFVRIYINSVIEKSRDNFKRANTKGFVDFDNFGTPYDYLSIMHYPEDAFAISGKNITIEPKDKSFLTKIGSRMLSKGDIKRIKSMYKCTR